MVLTSGLGGVFPEGLVVGKVARVERKDADPFQAAVVEPAVEMDKLERLYVLADSGQVTLVRVEVSSPRRLLIVACTAAVGHRAESAARPRAP